jgi:galactosamine-6-phosphate isomerase
VKLDEWLGVPMDNPHSCESYLRERLIGPLDISPRNYVAFDSMAPDPEEECNRVQRAMAGFPAIDVCVLGLGLNGHIGFNEPGEFLRPACRVAPLSEESRGHSMARSMDVPVEYGLTLGMADILASRQVVLLAAGGGKREVIDRLLSGQVSTRLPASFLWLHPNAMCIIDTAATK